MGWKSPTSREVCLFSKGPVSISDDVAVIFHQGLVAKYFLLLWKGEDKSCLRQLASLFLLLVARNLNNRKPCSRRRQQHLTLMSQIQTMSQKRPLKVAPPTPQQQTLRQTKRSCPWMEVSLGKTRASRQTLHTEPVSNGFLTLSIWLSLSQRTDQHCVKTYLLSIWVW